MCYNCWFGTSWKFNCIAFIKDIKEISIQEDTNVLNVILTPEGVKVITDKGEYVAKVVVGDDGFNGIVRRSVVGNDNSTSAMALEIYVDYELTKKFKPKSKNCVVFDFSYICDELQ